MGETARDSGNAELVEALLRFFVDNDLVECFCACLYTCYDLVRPDVALELAWRKNMMDYAMPFLIQVLREYTSRIDGLNKKTEKKEAEEEKQKSAANDYVPEYYPGIGMGGPGMPGMPQQPSMMMMPGRF